MVSVDRLAFDQVLAPFLDDLGRLYEEMDREYDRVAAHYGFKCTGCTDNCCFTRFYHYTFLEYLYLRKGFAGLPEPIKAEVRNRAEKYVKAIEKSESVKEDQPFCMMCPLNESGLCILYSRRPMICRLHGLPHELDPPGRQKMIFERGCHEFAEKCGHLPYFPFGRTRFYIRMSELETEVKKNLGIYKKPKKTVAHMLVSDEVAG